MDGQEATPAAIESHGLTRDFRRTRAVDDLNLQVPKGEIYGFLGPNGAGKTTTLKILAGLISPTAGKAIVAGEEVRPGTSSLDLRRRVGFLEEEPRFYPWMRARESLVFVGRLFGFEARVAEVRAEGLLEAVGLADRSDDKIRGFSRGMRQRLGIAQALVGDPEVLLLDEPASALDPIGRKEILDLIASLRGQATIIMSSHVLDDVQRVAGWVGVIRRGRLLTQGPLPRLLGRFTRPAYRLDIRGSDERSRVSRALAAESWCVEVLEEGSGLRLVVEDPAAVESRMPSLLAESAAPLQGFRAVTPTLEDVFLQLIGDEDEYATRRRAELDAPRGTGRRP
ncbi:MAG: ABC transporter ATP-binding protein [Actinobacteria bacterium]|nr:ABC transporter ATP-binding protein [Actinomycetota bacterium]